MMRAKIFYTMGMWAMGLILFISTFIAIRWAIDFATWTTLDSGWAQAIGAIVAIFWAVWIANRDSRERRNAAMAIGIITAASMGHRISQMIYCISEAIQSLDKADQSISAHSFVQQAASNLESCPPVTIEDIARLACFERDALSLAQAQSAVGYALNELRRMRYDFDITEHGVMTTSLNRETGTNVIFVLSFHLKELEALRKVFVERTFSAGPQAQHSARAY